MAELQKKYIGPSPDVPAGDIGVGGCEIGYLCNNTNVLAILMRVVNPQVRW